MRVLCAWCLKAGKGDAEALIGEREPVADKRTSHGICEHHRRELEERVTRLREEMRGRRNVTTPTSRTCGRTSIREKIRLAGESAVWG